MPFTLRIHLTGLILFAPDPAPPGKDEHPCLHALLLKHGHHHGKHFPRLVYDRGYEKPSPRKENHLRCRKLDNRLLKFENVGQPIDPQNGFSVSGTPGKLPKEVADLNKISNVRALNRKYVKLNPPQEVAARVTILDGKFTSCLSGALWTVKPPANTNGWPRQLTTLVTWEIPNIEKESIMLPLRSLRGENQQEDVTLFPIDGAIELWIYNATADDLPPQKNKQPKEGDPAEHFEAYYLPFRPCNEVHPILAKTPSIPPRNPTPSDCKPPKKGESEVGGPILAVLTADTPTCLTAQAEVE
ncbi:MAG: hypothetical protein M3497_00710 [Gemmatimonadota bacterium]|nr:hypothetical protein [Gemmatimonadota bacterium]